MFNKWYHTNTRRLRSNQTSYQNNTIYTTLSSTSQKYIYIARFVVCVKFLPTTKAAFELILGDNLEMDEEVATVIRGSRFTDNCCLNIYRSEYIESHSSFQI